MGEFGRIEVMMVKACWVNIVVLIHTYMFIST